MPWPTRWERFLRDEPVIARPPTATYLIRQLVRRHRVAFMAGAAVLVAVILGIVGTSIGLVRARQAEQQALAEAAAARQAQSEVEEVADFLVDLFEVNDPGEALGNTITARELLDRGASEIRTRLADQPLTRARLMDTMGTVYRQLGLPKPAVPLVEEALEVRERDLGTAHPDTMESRAVLGQLYWLAGRYEEAQVALEQALVQHEQAFGPDDPAVAEVLDHLGLGLRDPGVLGCGTRRLHPGAGDPRGDLRSRLAGDRLESGRSRRPAARPRGARRRGRPPAPRPGDPRTGPGTRAPGRGRHLQRSGHHPPSTGRARGSQGAPRAGLGDPRESPRARQSEVAQSLNNLAQVFLDLDLLNLAEPVLERALDIWERQLGPEHRRLGVALFNLGDLHRKRGDLAATAAAFERALTIFEASLGPEHPNIGILSYNLATVLRDAGRYARAEELFRRALAIREKVYGSDHQLVTDLRKEFAELLRASGRLSEAEAMASPPTRSD